MITDYHSQLYANELTLRAPSGTIERFAGALMNSRIDLNPHQVDAAVLRLNRDFLRVQFLPTKLVLVKQLRQEF